VELKSRKKKQARELELVVRAKIEGSFNSSDT
jgi:hypothetical protein